MVDCLPCSVGYHAECWKPDRIECCCAQYQANLELKQDIATEEKKERGGQLKTADRVKDIESTGRKRAAILYPIPKEGEPGYPMVCEWRMLEFAGGGKVPIIGCLDGYAKDIHHGPDKNTLANHVGNVHRICSRCHNRWHTLNDPLYPETRPPGNTPFVPADGDYKPHDGLRQADIDLVGQSEAAWALRNAKEFLEGRLNS